MKMEPTFPLGLDLDRSRVQRSMEGGNDVSVGKATGGTVSNVNGDVTLIFLHHTASMEQEGRVQSKVSACNTTTWLLT